MRFRSLQVTAENRTSPSGRPTVAEHHRPRFRHSSSPAHPAGSPVTTACPDDSHRPSAQLQSRTRPPIALNRPASPTEPLPPNPPTDHRRDSRAPSSRPPQTFGSNVLELLRADSRRPGQRTSRRPKPGDRAGGAEPGSCDERRTQQPAAPGQQRHHNGHRPRSPHPGGVTVPSTAEKPPHAQPPREPRQDTSARPTQTPCFRQPRPPGRPCGITLHVPHTFTRPPHRAPRGPTEKRVFESGGCVVEPGNTATASRSHVDEIRPGQRATSRNEGHGCGNPGCGTRAARRPAPLRPGYVQHKGPVPRLPFAHMTAALPRRWPCGSWLRVEPVGRSGWKVVVHGPRDLWKELQDLAGRWRAAGRPAQLLPPSLRAGRRPAGRIGMRPSVLAPSRPPPAR